MHVLQGLPEQKKMPVCWEINLEWVDPAVLYVYVTLPAAMYPKLSVFLLEERIVFLLDIIYYVNVIALTHFLFSIFSLFG